MIRSRLIAATAVLAVLPFTSAQAQTPPVFRIQRLPTAPIPAAAAPNEPAQTEITRPAGVPAPADPEAVTLKSGSSAANIRSLPVRRQFSLQQVRSARTLVVGGTRMDLAPMLANPRALFNLADRIRQRPDIAEVAAEDTQVYEIDQGLVVRSFLNYRIKTGACSDGRRGAVTGVGLSCASQMTDQARTAAFANPRDLHYLADPARRADALDKARTKGAQIEADLRQSVATVRAALADPAKRAEFDSQLGAGTSARLATLTDDQLTAEIVNSGETAVEQTFFVPRIDRVRQGFAKAYPIRNALKLAAPKPPLLIGSMVMQQANPSIFSGIIQTNAAQKVEIEPHIFLTGFTLGRAYEWNQRIEKTIKTCLVSCKKTYYVEVFAGFNYGFGLRFPIKVDGTQTFTPGTNGGMSASLQTRFTPINGDEASYLATGLPSDKLFSAKELVAQIGAHAGASYKLPIIGGDTIDVPVELDLTSYLPGDFVNGQITPPTPGGSFNPKATKTFYEVDLTGGIANLGVIGAKVFPAAEVELVSDKLTFTLYDKVLNKETVLSAGGPAVSLGVRNGKDTEFTLGDPKYNVAFHITPGLTARLFVDLALWSHNWDFPVWFPQLSVKLPPDGVEFSCHEGTECSRNYQVSPSGVISKAGAAAGLPSDLEKWGNAFDARYLEQCVDEICRIGIRFTRQGTIYYALHKFDANPALTMANFTAELAKAEQDARQVIDEAQMRQTKKASDSFGILYQEVWSKRCSDKICLDKVKGIVAFHRAEINAQQKLNPDMSTNQILGDVGKKFLPVYQAEIDASKARVATEQAAAAKRATSQVQTPVLKVLRN